MLDTTIITVLAIAPSSSDLDRAGLSNTPLDKVASDYNEGFQLIKLHKPDVVIDITNEEKTFYHDSVSFAEKVKAFHDNATLIVIDEKKEKKKIDGLLRAGVAGIIESGTYHIQDVICYIKNYEYCLGPWYQKVLLNEIQQRNQITHDDNFVVIDQEVAESYFSKREIDILETIIHSGGYYEEIAKRIYLAPATVRNYINQMLKRMKANNRTHLVTICIKKGIININNTT